MTIRMTNGDLLFTTGMICLLGFFVLDYAYSTWRKDIPTAIPLRGCVINDAIRHHALAANCTGRERWGERSYVVHTNDIGLRDHAVRAVAHRSEKPRVLVLGDSYVRGHAAWDDTIVGMIARQRDDLEVLNGGVSSYSPSNYLNVTRQILDAGYHVDEIIVFADISDIQDEAAFYVDSGVNGAVSGPERRDAIDTVYTTFRDSVGLNFFLTDALFKVVERATVALGLYHLPRYFYGGPFNQPRSAWTYGGVDERRAFPAGYAPLGVAGGIAKATDKMSRLAAQAMARGIPLSVVVYPWPAQIARDGAADRYVNLWKNWCAGRCKRFVSAFPRLLAEKNQCPTLLPGCWYARNYLFGDIHGNARGNGLIAGVVLDALARVPIARHAD